MITEAQMKAYSFLYGKGVGRPTGIVERLNREMKETWLPATSKTRPCVLRFKKGQLEQLWVCSRAQKAEWRKIPKRKEE